MWQRYSRMSGVMGGVGIESKKVSGSGRVGGLGLRLCPTSSLHEVAQNAVDGDVCLFSGAVCGQVEWQCHVFCWR